MLYSRLSVDTLPPEASRALSLPLGTMPGGDGQEASHLPGPPVTAPSHPSLRVGGPTLTHLFILQRIKRARRAPSDLQEAAPNCGSRFPNTPRGSGTASGTADGSLVGAGRCLT